MLRSSSPHDDPALGRLERRRGCWRGSVTLTGHGPVPLAVPGGRTHPDPEALAVARTTVEQVAASADAVAAALDEHRHDLAASLGEPLAGGAPALLGVEVVRIGGRWLLELAWSVPWDDDHTLGARLVDGVLVELNGSIVPR